MTLEITNLVAATHSNPILVWNIPENRPATENEVEQLVKTKELICTYKKGSNGEIIFTMYNPNYVLKNLC